MKIPRKSSGNKLWNQRIVENYLKSLKNLVQILCIWKELLQRMEITKGSADIWCKTTELLKTITNRQRIL